MELDRSSPEVDQTLSPSSGTPPAIQAERTLPAALADLAREVQEAGSAEPAIDALVGRMNQAVPSILTKEGQDQLQTFVRQVLLDDPAMHALLSDLQRSQK